jgi:Ca-activated chloride channel homolog
MQPASKSGTAYEQLGIDATREPRLIRRQYRLLARLYHPDVNPSADAQRRFMEVQEAYDALRHSLKEDESPTTAMMDHALQVTARPYPTTLTRAPGPQRAYILLRAGAPADACVSRTPLNLILALDTSSSMRGQRLHHVREAARRIIEALSPVDTFGLVTFNDRATVLLPADPVGDGIVARSALDSMTAFAGTEIASGLRAGLEELKRHHSPQTISHLILLTDGRTYGDEADALDLARMLRQMGIGMTALGLGTDWNESFLDDLARRGGGTSQFLPEPGNVTGVFVTQLQRLQQVYARDATLSFSLEEGVSLLQAHEVAPGLRALQPAGDKLPLGLFPAGEPLSLLLSLKIEPPERDVALLGSFTLRARLASDRTPLTARRLTVVEIATEGDEAPPEEIYQAARRVATLTLQERALRAVADGNLTRALPELENLANRFLDIGAPELAARTRQEIDEVRRTGGLSPAGTKTIRYGTSRLALPAPLEATG